MIEVEERDDLTPICPHCGEAIASMLCRKISAFWGKRYVYFCGACRKVLGVSHRKGFWMG